jgi:hypothetical protein
MKNISALIVLMLMAACVTAPPKEQMANMSQQALCDLHYRLGLMGSPDKAQVALELERRQQLTPAELQGIARGAPQVGMDVMVLYCTWGMPNDINRTATASGVMHQFVFEKYYGRTLGSTFRFAYVVNNRIIALQD